MLSEPSSYLHFLIIKPFEGNKMHLYFFVNTFILKLVRYHFYNISFNLGDNRC